MNKVDFGTKLKELRDAKGESQADLGSLLEVGEKQIQRYEKGDVLPTHENLESLCKHYEYDFISLLFELKPKKGNDNLSKQKDGFYDKYLSLLEKNDKRNERIIEQQEEDLKTLRTAVNKITSVDQKVNKLDSTVNALKEKFRGYEPTILGLREFVTAEIAALKKKSHEEVAAALNIKVEEQRQVVEQSYIQNS